MKSLKMPRVDPAMEKGMMVTWAKREGDEVNEGDHVATIMTEKVEFEIQSPFSGILHRILAPEGSEIAVGEVIATMTEPGEAPSSSGFVEVKRTGVRISPAARRLAEDHKIDVGEIRGTGPDGRIVREDILRIIEETGRTAADRGYKSVKMSPLRMMTAQRMSMSHQTIPPVTLVVDIDAEQLVRIKEQLNIFYDAIFVKVLSKALREHDVFNAASVEDVIRVSSEINIGVAVTTGNELVVPVVHNADKKNVNEISQEIENLASKARSGRLTMEDVGNGTFTFTNLGMYGVDTFTPIIVPGQTAILGAGRVMKRVIVQGDSMVIRPQVSVSLTFDHRVADGSTAAEFLDRIRQLIEGVPALWESTP